MILFCFLLPVMASAQKIAVIDRKLERPATYIATLRMSDLEGGAFVIEKSNFAAIIESLRSYRSLIDDRKDLPENMKSLVNGTSYFTATGKNGDFSIVLDTKIDKMGSYFIVADKSNSRRKNIEKISQFISYLENNAK